MKVLVTGGAGFIGAHVAKQLLEDGHQVVVVDNFNEYYPSEFKKARVKNLLESFDKVKIIEVDITDLEKMKAVFEKDKPDKIIHLAAMAGVRYSIKDPFLYQHVNVTGTLVLLELARLYGVKNLVVASSSSVYGASPHLPFQEDDSLDLLLSVYATTKRSLEHNCYAYHRLYGLNIVALRFFNVYGPWGRPDGALFKFTDAILQGKPIRVHNYGRMRRDFTYIDDIVNGIISAVEKEIPYEVFNLGNGVPVELEQFIKYIEKYTGQQAIRNDIPMQPGETEVSHANIAKAVTQLGYNPQYKVEEGVKNFVEWFMIWRKEFPFFDNFDFDKY